MMIEAKGVSLDLNSSVAMRENTNIQFSVQEARALELLMKNQGVLITHSMVENYIKYACRKNIQLNDEKLLKRVFCKINCGFSKPVMQPIAETGFIFLPEDPC